MSDRNLTDDPNRGRVLRGQYLVQSKLGQGAMGIVYRGMQQPIRRPVAIKLMLPTPTGEQLMREHRFRREAEAMAALRDEHTVRVFDYGVTERQEPFLIMELLHGCNLEQLVQQEGPLDPSVALWLSRQVLLGLAEAHALGITHRDLKPSNVFLSISHTGRICAKLMDFGIAGFNTNSTTNKLTLAGELIGTPAYMPPELLQGKPFDARGDLYSFGVLLFELLTGRLPFEQTSMAALFEAHLSTPPPRLPGLGAPRRALQKLLDRLLAKDPEDRFSDCATALHALDEVRHELRRDASQSGIVRIPPRDSDVSPELAVCADSAVSRARLRLAMDALWLMFLLCLLTAAHCWSGP
jgi:eukaryotic-like serine/threonine-protein kinase